MAATPTLQTLAVYAREHFGEDGYSAEEGAPSSLDVVVDGFNSALRPESAADEVATVLRRQMEVQGRMIEAAHAREFTRVAISYLREVYPDARAMDEEEQVLLSRLFCGHLVEAQFAADAAPASSGKDRAARAAAVA
jgi:hypothetical protein